MNTKQKYEFADWMIHTVIPERLYFLNGEMKPESSTYAVIAGQAASLRSLPLIDNAVVWNAARPIILRDLRDLRDLSDRFEALYRGHAATAIERGYLSVPVVPQIDAAILTVIETSGAHHEQNAWHSNCGTSHCRGGFAVVVAGRAGRELERKFGTPAAAALIYIASRPGQPIPDFYDMNNERVLADIKKCAAEQTAEANS